MPNMNKLQGQLKEKGVTVGDLAVAIGVDKSTLYRWIADNGVNIPIDAANTIYRELDLTPEVALEIFFGK